MGQARDPIAEIKLRYHDRQEGGIVANPLNITKADGKGWRREGNTTKQVDYLIDALFQGCVIACLDHFERGINREANRRLMGLIIDRLTREHHFKLDRLYIDYNAFTMYIKYQHLDKVYYKEEDRYYF